MAAHKPTPWTNDEVQTFLCFVAEERIQRELDGATRNEKYQKSEADLEYLEKRLKLDFVNSATENGSAAEENPVALLENLAAIKARHAALCSQVKELAAVQKESMDSIKTHLNSTMQLIQRFQQTADVEVLPLRDQEQEAAEILGSAGLQRPAEVNGCSMGSTVAPSYANLYVGLFEEKFVYNPTENPFINKITKWFRYIDDIWCLFEAHNLSELEDLNEATLEAVPLSIRSNVKLADLTAFYQQLQQHFSNKTNSGSLSIRKMKQLNIKVSNAKLKTLQHLSLVELDHKGHVRLLI
ncbi:SKA complex subunit 2 [Diretmus argenteus]